MQLGKMIEDNVRRSLNLADVGTTGDFQWDLHRKVDCLVESIDGHGIPGGLAVQVSLRDDLVKARVAKLIALTKFRYFIYLLVRDPKVFQTPSAHAGADLKRLLLHLMPLLQRERALAVEIGDTVNVMSL